ncbi:MAG: 50S ribosomal protein L30 [Anaerolineae bacterium]
MAEKERSEDDHLEVTWVKSAIGYSKSQKATIRALGLKRLGDTVRVPNSPSVRGMVRTVIHLLRVEGMEA